MSAAAALLAMALLILAVLTVGQLEAPVMRLAVDLTALGSAVAFGLGFAPPRTLRLSWRRPEEEQLRAGTVAVLEAQTSEQVARELLPPTAHIVGGGRAALVDRAGRVWAAHGDAPGVGSTVEYHVHEKYNGASAGGRSARQPTREPDRVDKAPTPPSSAGRSVIS